LSTVVLHANWTAGALHLWAEVPPTTTTPTPTPTHPFAASHQALVDLLPPILPPDAIAGCQQAQIILRLPVHTTESGNFIPIPSPRAAHALGHVEHEAAPILLEAIPVPAIRLPMHMLAQSLQALDGAFTVREAIEHQTDGLVPGPGLDFFIAADHFAQWLLAQQRFVPALVQDLGGGVRGLWQPWLADEAVATRAGALLRALPPAARAPVDALGHEPWAVLEDFLVHATDARARAIMVRETMADTLQNRHNTGTDEAQQDPHVTWLAGLLGTPDAVNALGTRRADMLKRVRGWIGGLDQRSADAGWRLCLKVVEPRNLPDIPGVLEPTEATTWNLQLLLQSIENPASTVAAADIWILPTDGAMVAGRRIDAPQELLLAELGRAARVYKPLEKALGDAEPAQLPLSTQQAYEFLREHRQLLLEQGFGVLAPTWWDSPAARLGVRLKLDSPESIDPTPTAPGASPIGPHFGLNALVNYKWQISLGQNTLSIDEFQRLATLKSPLVYVGGKWVEVRPEDIKAAVGFLRDNPGGQIEIGRALRMAYGVDPRSASVPVTGIEATGWAASIFATTGTSESQKTFTMPMLDAPPGFVGSLRPYQVKGLSWLAFLDRLGLGSCLADDMGLGKTIQLLAMLLHERLAANNLAAGAGPVHLGPSLLIVPMSVVGNWARETKRFAPSLRVYIHHGPERKLGQPLRDAALNADLVITTYALAHRDRAELEAIGWHRVALDEAQNIKNPAAKQTQAVRAIDAPRRIALTGTPIENRLTELWSIMDFLNPTLLGTVHDFRTKFATPIEKFNDAARGKQLRALVQPFVLRRLKTDPLVIADLPEKVESKEFCYLTPEQASLYEQVVKGMLQQAEAAEGITRRGVILAGLTKLKQICNHPLQYLRQDLDEEGAPIAPLGPAPAARSGKATRLVQMLDEVVAAEGQALVFTQFRAMGEMLAPMLRHELDREVLLLHGGTSAKDRDALVARFQRSDGTAPIFVLSLKAGGIGLNLTAANHVFHYDRWWNPAVENQATDRAFRIGQTRTVQVHKFVVAGTLEEKIDQMIESKSNLADSVIGSGEGWLTELSLAQLREVLTLRPDAVETDSIASVEDQA